MFYVIISYVNGFDHQNDESQQSYTSHNKTGRYHNHHNRHHLNRHKIRDHFSQRDDNVSISGQLVRNSPDFESNPSPTIENHPGKNWKPPMNPSSFLFSDQSFNRSSRKRNNSSVKQPNIIFILTDDQDIELGKCFGHAFKLCSN